MVVKEFKESKYNPTYITIVSSIILLAFLLVFGRLNQVRTAQLIEIFVVCPELVLNLGLEACNFVKNAEIRRVFLRGELSGYLLQKLALVISQAALGISVLVLIRGQEVDSAVLLDRRLKQRLCIMHIVTLLRMFCFVIKVAQLVGFEVGDKGALVLLEHELCEE